MLGWQPDFRTDGEHMPSEVWLGGCHRGSKLSVGKPAPDAPGGAFWPFWHPAEGRDAQGGRARGGKPFKVMQKITLQKLV